MSLLDLASSINQFVGAISNLIQLALWGLLVYGIWKIPPAINKLIKNIPDYIQQWERSKLKVVAVERATRMPI